jgi:outer membrane protein OmpA-like peptidoglycan-associated protein
MNNKISRISFILFIIVANIAFAQKPKNDSTSAEIKQQALEMRDKVNKYMADRLLIDDSPKTPALNILLDSVSKMLNKQQEQIELLKNTILELNESVEKQIDGTQEKIRFTQLSIASSHAIPGGFKQLDNKSMVFFLPFDAYKLSASQIKVLKKFIEGKTINSIKVYSYTDKSGTEEYNMNLAQKRANEFVEYLSLESNVLIEQKHTAGCGTGDINNDNWCRRVELFLN